MIQRLLDTNAVSNLLRNDDGIVAARLRQTGIKGVALSIIVVAEVEFGISNTASSRIRKALDRLRSILPVLAFEEPADRIYGKIRAELKRRGKIIGSNDLLIAAHALALDATLVTDNEREFSRVPGLKIENWMR